MVFNSFEFLVFFIIVTGIYFLLADKYRWAHLLLASCIFYMYFIPVYIVILFATIVIDYFAGILIEESKTPQKRKAMLVVSLIANIGVLAVFKYYNFFINNVNDLLGYAGSDTSMPLLNIILPIGLSFHTFQAMSYTIEVYRGNQQAERHFGIYSLYVMFYPQLVAGPIERPQNIIHQLKEKHSFDYSKVVSGLRLVLWGLIKKVVVADRIAIMVNEVYGHHNSYGGLAIIIATALFAVQIYCDFSGYSDIALGTARVMGYTLMRNFDMPYFAKSVTEFWRRWHMSLTTWFRDYLYIPLGGSRVSKPRWYFNLFIVFLLSGLWHGANWTYVIWGGLLGSCLIIEASTRNIRSRMEQQVNPLLFNFSARFLTITFICFTWIFFRSTSVSQAFDMLKIIVTGDVNYFQLGQINLTGISYLGQPLWKFMLSIALVPALFLVEYIHRNWNLIKWVEERNIVLRWSVYYLMITVVLIFGSFSIKEFIYFQF